MPGKVIIGAGECGVRAASVLREHGYKGAVTLISEEYALPYERPPLSKGATEPKAIRREEDYASANIDLRRGARVEAIEVDNDRLRLNDGARIEYDQLLIATGARPRLLSGMDGCLTLRTNEDADHILQLVRTGARVGIVGRGDAWRNH